MKWFANLKIAHKLAVSFSLCIVLMVFMGATALSRMAQLNTATRELVSDSVQGLKAMAALTGHANGCRRFELRSLLERDTAGREAAENMVQENLAGVAADFANYEKTISQEEEKRNTEQLKTLWASYVQEHTKIVEMWRKKDFTQATATGLGDQLKQFNAVEKQVDVMRGWNGTQADELAKKAETLNSSGRALILELLAVAITLTLITIFLLTRQITGVVTQIMTRLDAMDAICMSNLNNAVDAMAAGDMTAKIQTGTNLLDIDSKDEFGVMASTFNRVIKKLQATIASFEKCQAALSQTLGQVQGAAGSIATASAEVSAGNEDLSQRTEEQAASLEETAASMEEMAATVKNNADSSRQANQLAVQARSVAEKGGVVVGQAVASMAEINVVSKRIADIVTVIDEIAFQTNLLALNAAVEAARVGEQGKGFAVVAAEVRTLAGRSATAAKEIKALVLDSVAKVQEGSELVNQSGEQLEEIITSVKKVADMIAEISAAGAEQSEGIEQVNKAVMQMDQITQQNAALVEEATAASQAMSQQANMMQGTVSQFKIDAQYQQANAPTRMPVAHKATGTHGGGRKLSVASAPKLKMTPRTAPDKAAANDNSDFEEF